MAVTVYILGEFQIRSSVELTTKMNFIIKVLLSTYHSLHCILQHLVPDKNDLLI